MKKLITNPVYQFFVRISPWVLAYLIAISWKPLFPSIPEKTSLTSLNGTIESIGKRSGVINTANGQIKVKYDCLCDQNSSEKLFAKGMPFTALGQPKENGYYLWDLRVDGQEILSYDSNISRLLELREFTLSYSVPAIILFSLLSLQLGSQFLHNRRLKKSKAPLYPLLDHLHDQEKSDDERLSVLPEILEFDLQDILGALEYMATQNTNSEVFLTRLGTELGKLWSNMDISELEGITLVQPAAKRAAMEVIKNRAPELSRELDSIGALKLGQ